MWQRLNNLKQTFFSPLPSLSIGRSIGVHLKSCYILTAYYIYISFGLHATNKKREKREENKKHNNDNKNKNKTEQFMKCSI